MSDGYFVVKLVDGTILDFDGKCDLIDYRTSNIYTVFKQSTGGGRFYVLAMIPHKSIFSITNESD